VIGIDKEELDALRKAAALSGAASQSWSVTQSERSCSSRRPQLRL
jgi:hypothetical protein